MHASPATIVENFPRSSTLTTYAGDCLWSSNTNTGAVRRIGEQFARGLDMARATEPSALRIRLTGSDGSTSLASVESLAGVGAKLTRAQVTRASESYLIELFTR